MKTTHMEPEDKSRTQFHHFHNMTQSEKFKELMDQFERYDDPLLMEACKGLLNSLQESDSPEDLDRVITLMCIIRNLWNTGQLNFIAYTELLNEDIRKNSVA